MDHPRHFGAPELGFWRKAVCWALIALSPSTVLASDTDAAMFEVLKGAAFQNGNAVPGSVAILPGDYIQTQPDSAGKITVNGSSVLVEEESLIKYLPAIIGLGHGGVSVMTQKYLVVQAGDVIVTPITEGQVQYEVTDRDGIVHIAARKGDVKLEHCGDRDLLKEGYEYTCEERRGGYGSLPAGKPSLLTTRNVLIGGAVAGGVLCAILCRPGPTPMSSWKP